MIQDEVAHILEKNRERLTGYLRAVARDRCLAEDIFQEVSLKAVQRGGSFTCEKHLIRWFHVAGKNRAIDHFRKQKKSHLLLDESVLDQLAAEAPRAEQDPALRALDTCIETLTPRSRRILSLRYGDELSGIDVARQLNQKVDTVYKALTRIYTHLRRCIEQRTATSTCSSK